MEDNLTWPTRSRSAHIILLCLCGIDGRPEAGPPNCLPRTHSFFVRVASSCSSYALAIAQLSRTFPQTLHAAPAQAMRIVHVE